jgi:hypothetical protein
MISTLSSAQAVDWSKYRFDGFRSSTLASAATSLARSFAIRPRWSTLIVAP